MVSSVFAYCMLLSSSNDAPPIATRVKKTSIDKSVVNEMIDSLSHPLPPINAIKFQ